MRITCPACDAVYDVPETILPRPRLMRCARCAHDFRPPVDDAPAASGNAAIGPASDAPASSAATGWDGSMPARPLPPHPRMVSTTERVQVLAAWAASVAAIVAFAWLGIAYRHPVMQAWPPSVRLYAALGYAHAASSAPKAP